MRHLCLLATVLLSMTAQPALAQDSVGRAVTKPLRDTRIKDDKIPEILQLASSAPYSARGMTNCRAIGAEIARLNTALGADVDVPTKKKGDGAAIAATAASVAIGSIIPGLGLVRVLTGADKQQRRVEAAVFAGAVRRGYLKGLGASKRCAPPAAPTAAARTATQQIIAPDKDDKEAEEARPDEKRDPK